MREIEGQNIKEMWQSNRYVKGERFITQMEKDSVEKSKMKGCQSAEKRHELIE